MISSSLRKNSVSRPFGEGHDFQRLRKNSAPRPFGEGHEFQRLRENSAPRRFGEGHEFQTLRKNSAPRRFGEGHEFHSCRNRRPINSGFQPLGEFSPAKRLFPFRAGSGEGHEFQRLRKNSAPRRFGEGHEFHSCRKCRPFNGGFQPLGEFSPAKRLFPFRAGSGEGHDFSRAADNRQKCGLLSTQALHQML